MFVRLTEQQRAVIRQAGLRYFGVVPQLFGSRLDDGRLGGDIDLFIPGDWGAEGTLRKRLAFLAEVKGVLGEQKIDLLLERPDLPVDLLSTVKCEGREV